jgi:hypothetical protein
MLMRFGVRLEAAKRIAKAKAPRAKAIHIFIVLDLFIVRPRYDYVTFKGTKGAAVALQRSERTAPDGRMRMQGESSWFQLISCQF